MLLFALAACIDNEFTEKPDRPDRGLRDTGDTDAPDTDTDPGDTGDTTVDTGDTTVDTADTTVDTGDTTVDTGDTPVETGDTTDTVDTGDTPVDTGEPPDTAPPGPIEITGTCGGGYAWTGWSDPAAVEPELNVIGVYESGAGGPVAVTVTRTASMTLFLTSYSAIDWQVDLAAGTNVTQILVSSYDPSTVTFTSATTAPVSGVGWIGACGYEYPDVSISGCETPDLINLTQTATGLTLSSFQGCYAGTDFTIEG